MDQEVIDPEGRPAGPTDDRDPLLEELCDEIRAAHLSAARALAVEVASRIIATLFDGSVEAWRAGGRAHPEVRRLAQRWAADPCAPWVGQDLDRLLDLYELELLRAELAAVVRERRQRADPGVR